MKENNHEDFVSGEFEEILGELMMDIYLKKLMKGWFNEIMERHREGMVSLSEYIGKGIDFAEILFPKLTIRPSGVEMVVLSISTEGEELCMFVFSDGVCTDAFRIPNHMITKCMSGDLLAGFIRYFKNAGPDEPLLNGKPWEGFQLN